MIKNKKIITVLLAASALVSCTKLDEHLNSTYTQAQFTNVLGPNGVQTLLQLAYVDLGTPFTGQDEVFSLEENTADESLVPTRGGDWDDNGVWRVMHNHTWNADHGQILQVFNNLNKLNFDATNVLGFKPSTQQAAEARFLRALSLYYLVDLYGQFPVRNPGDNLLNAPQVYSGAAAAAFIISELNAIMNDLPADNKPSHANQTVGKVLLMKCLLNQGAWANRASPTFADADMQQVVTLGTSIMGSGAYTYEANYFHNFDVNNGNSTENIFTYVNTSGVGPNNSGTDARWMMTNHYNQYTPDNPNAGWNGFSTVSDFYNSFGVGTPMVGVTQFAAGNISGLYADSAVDGRVGEKYYPGVTNISGIKPGFMIGQMYDQNGVAEMDRKGHPLAFDPTISPDMKETGSNLEVTGIRVEKYPPDLSAGPGTYEGPSGNDLVIFRYSDVALMVAEAKLRQSAADPAGALAIVNQLRAARSAAPIASLSLVNTGNLYDVNTLLAERGRELYWESVRRTDLIRFGMFNVIWQYKPSDAATYLVFPVPNQALAANPNLKQNPGY